MTWKIVESRPAVAVEHAELETCYYEVEGCSIETLKNFMKENGPCVDRTSRYAALFWHVRWNWCDKSIYHAALMVLPNWKQDTNPLISQRQMLIRPAWTTFLKRLVEHEKKHFDNVLRGVELLRETIKAATAQSEFEKRAAGILEDMHLFDAELDRVEGNVELYVLYTSPEVKKWEGKYCTECWNYDGVRCILPQSWQTGHEGRTIQKPESQACKSFFEGVQKAAYGRSSIR